MEEDGSHMTERMLQLTLEIIYLLTGENYSVVKTASLESFFCGFFPSMADRWIRRRSPVSTPPPCSSPTPERSNKQRILEVRTRLVELLAAQDMAAALPVEKWECREGSWDLYTEAMMEAEPADLPTAEATEENPGLVTEEHHSLGEENPLPLSDSSAHEYSTPQIKEEPLRREEYPALQIKEEHLPRKEYPTPQIKEELLPFDNSGPLITLPHCLHTPSGHGPAEARLPKMHHDPTSRNKEEHLHNELTHPLRYNSSLSIEENHLDNEEKRLQPSDASLHDEQHPHHYDTALHNADNPLPRYDSFLRSEISHAEVSPVMRHQREQSLSMAEPLSHQGEHSLHPDISVYGQYGAAPGSSSKRASVSVKHGGRLHSRRDPVPHPRCCPICRHRFDSQSQLEEHRAVHTGRKPYRCCVCRRTFPNKPSLSIHHKRHMEVSPAALGEGGKRFGRDEGRGACPGQKPYLCLECGKCFSSYSSLYGHQKIHTGLKPHACSECGKCFIRSFHLKRHMIVHRK